MPKDRHSKVHIEIPGYEILHELGRGGLSAVYLAEQRSLGRKVALKVLSPALSSDPGFKQRFLRQGAMLAQLNHPNISTIYDIGSFDSSFYTVSEYLTGGTLAERIAKGLPIEESIQIIREISSALQYAHSRGVIHRDVKPSNILFREDNTAVLDFGIPRSIDTTSTHLESTGLSIGTPNYMSPEQIQGLSLDGRSDFYSLGAVFYEMLTGDPPYQGEDALATALKHLNEPVPELAPSLAYLQPILDRMLAKKPADRFSNEQAFLAALGEEVTNRAVAPRGAKFSPFKPSWWGRVEDQQAGRPPPPPHGPPPPKGTLVYNAPDRMRVQQSEIIEARVAPEIVRGLLEDFDGKGELIADSVSIASLMRLQLHGDPSVFRIHNEFDNPQLLYEQHKGFAEWRWQVLPLRRGKHTLRLTISGETVGKDGLSGAIAFEPIIRTIIVTINPAHTATQLAKWVIPLTAAAAIGAIAGDYATKLVGL